MNSAPRSTERDVVLASADAALRQRLRDSLTGLRWRVHEASGGAEALTLLENQPSDALLMDGWLPDLEAVELAGHIALMYPAVDVLSVDGGALTSTRSTHRHELLHALREAQQGKTDTAAWNAAPTLVPRTGGAPWGPSPQEQPAAILIDVPSPITIATRSLPVSNSLPRTPPIPGLIGDSTPMRELTHLIRLVAPRNSTVLIEGETGHRKRGRRLRDPSPHQSLFQTPHGAQLRRHPRSPSRSRALRTHPRRLHGSRAVPHRPH